jgi:transposase-like protein
MEVELTDHLGYEPHLEPPGGVGNARNGTNSKTLLTEHGPVQVDAPRDRNGSFQPQIVRKRQRRLRGSTRRSSPSIPGSFDQGHRSTSG